MENYGAIQQRGFLSKKRGGTISGDTLYNPAGAISDNLELTNKQYVDAAVAGLGSGDQLDSARVASTADIDLTTGGELTIDGVALSAGDRVLVKDQTSTEENGVYVVAAGAWSRATDLDETSEATENVWIFVSEGTLYADTGWKISTAPTALGTDPLAWTQFSGTGATSNPVKRGTATIASGGTVSVAFGAAFPGTDYTIKLAPSMNCYPHYENKAAGGFDIVVQSTAVTGDVDWEATYNV